MVLKTYNSKSSNAVHEVRMAQDGETIYCTCRGWKMYRKCWHLEDYIAKNGIVTANQQAKVETWVQNSGLPSVSLQDIIDQEVRRLTL